MKKKVLALGLALVMCMSLSMTAFAASSSTTNNSGDQSSSSSSSTTSAAAEAPKTVAEVVSSTPAGGAVKAEAVKLAVASADGTARTTTLANVVASKQAEVKAVVAAVAAQTGTAQAATAISSILTVPASEQFTATVAALAEIKGSTMVVNNCGSVKTAAVAKDALGNTIASAGVIKNVTSGALIMLMSVNADGSIEYVEGVVDPVTGAVLGAFQGTPAVITVLVLA
ncbi:MAG: hypothetical protein J6D08_00540 [Lachnospiraceae bacterium]|nr:hypothetical protein [Lachnospiraceae bacterium]